ncbi:MAG: hypothetical protein GX868_06845, partial [Actinobacteria bacterium]|nr:hypothetical protein [Actinomycetota bacterium]
MLKSRYSTWWTGKLSDVAGVAMIAVLAAIILGSRRGPLVAAAAFTAVKTVPGLAELAAPILGGTTLRDATDLIALAVVPLVVVLLERGHGRHPAPHQPSARCRSTSLRILATIGLAGSVVATTATSCDPDDGVQTVIAEDGRLYAAYG